MGSALSCLMAWASVARPRHEPRTRRGCLAVRQRAAPHRSCLDRKSTRLNSSHVKISYAVCCLKKKKMDQAAIEDAQIGGFDLDRRVGSLYQCAAQPAVALPGLARQALTRALVVPRTEFGPTGQMCGTWKPRHVRADFCHQLFRDTRSDARNLIPECHRLGPTDWGHRVLGMLICGWSDIGDYRQGGIQPHRWRGKRG